MIAFKILFLVLITFLTTSQNLQAVTDPDPINLAELETPEFLAQVYDAVQRANSGQPIVSVLMNLDQQTTI